MSKRIRIGCASGFWGDSEDGARQLLYRDRVDYLVFDYLSEVTMSILARARAKDPRLGYARDFVSPTMRGLLGRIAETGTKVIANAGGINPLACRDALADLIDKQRLNLKIAVVLGDDLMLREAELRAADVEHMDDGSRLPESLYSVNAYLGAEPIRAALELGADMVITGRCADSAIVLAPLMHEFGWQASDYDRLAGGSLAGHIVECGVQAVGGNFTDWEQVEGWEDMGFPIVDCAEDGSFIVTKPEGTGGLVTPLTVGEQLLYELGEPATYILPDVICDFTHVSLTDLGHDRVEVKGARGRVATDSYKVSATYQDGFRSTAMFTMVGRNNRAKIEKVGGAILARTRRLFRERGFGDYRRVSLKIIGAEDVYGPHARQGAMQSREQLLRLDVHHDEAEALKIFTREIAPAGTAMGPGRCSLVGGRPDVTPLVRLFSFLWPKNRVEIEIDINGQRHPVVVARGEPFQPPAPAQFKEATSPDWDGPSRRMALADIAVARSGDKGNTVNIGVIARKSAYLPIIAEQVTAEAVKAYFAHLAHGPVQRYALPGFDAFNFLLHEALDGGGVASLRNDPLGKGFAQMLLDMPIEMPVALLDDA
ncbi:acyclic terpene utilization AtuA family protein [Rhodoligotrophos ferricapiens]|uniref:acyclic terpene utilization AtuA family protein n=1 Tax=Rhodoligotrophos ferricapiens TaxID=3069264 RepID=UPI00315CA1FB